jgi:hypothetical protein
VELYFHSPNTLSWRGAQLRKAQGQLYVALPCCKTCISFVSPCCRFHLLFRDPCHNVFCPSVPCSLSFVLHVKILQNTSYIGIFFLNCLILLLLLSSPPLRVISCVCVIMSGLMLLFFRILSRYM